MACNESVTDAAGAMMRMAEHVAAARAVLGRGNPSYAAEAAGHVTRAFGPAADLAEAACLVHFAEGLREEARRPWADPNRKVDSAAIARGWMSQDDHTREKRWRAIDQLCEEGHKGQQQLAIIVGEWESSGATGLAPKRRERLGELIVETLHKMAFAVRMLDVDRRVPWAWIVPDPPVLTLRRTATVRTRRENPPRELFQVSVVVPDESIVYYELPPYAFDVSEYAANKAMIHPPETIRKKLKAGMYLMIRKTAPEARLVAVGRVISGRGPRLGVATRDGIREWTGKEWSLERTGRTVGLPDIGRLGTKGSVWRAKGLHRGASDLWKSMWSTWAAEDRLSFIATIKLDAKVRRSLWSDIVRALYEKLGDDLRKSYDHIGIERYISIAEDPDGASKNLEFIQKFQEESYDLSFPNEDQLTWPERARRTAIYKSVAAMYGPSDKRSKTAYEAASYAGIGLGGDAELAKILDRRVSFVDVVWAGIFFWKKTAENRKRN